MKSKIAHWVFALMIVVSFLAQEAWSGIGLQEYRARRQQVMSAMDSSSVLVVRSAETMARSGDVNYPYHQNEDFYYLTGSRDSGGLLLLVPAGYSVSGQTVREILFVPEASSSAYFGEGLGPEAAKKLFGMDAALPADKFQLHFSRILAGKTRLFLAPLPQAFINDPVAGKGFFLDRESKKLIKDKFPGLQIKSSGALLNPLRRNKSASELALMQKAIDATCTAQREAMKSCAPGLFEYELQAAIEYSFMRNGCAADAFPSIVGSGPNSIILHYDANERMMQSGDMVVMDIGGEYQGYCADVTRTIPVNGKFTPEQRQIYNLVLLAHDQAIEMIKPGITIRDLDKKAAKVIGEGLVELGLLKEAGEVANFLPHGISHSLGMQAHDVDSSEPLAEGMVITIEPGIYIAEKMAGVDAKYWNTGIRIEDDVLVTKEGHKVLSNAPITAAEIEKLMKQQGIGNKPIG
jgi:Xaa-Pro aminopeptidase